MAMSLRERTAKMLSSLWLLRPILSPGFVDASARLKDPMVKDYKKWAEICMAEAIRIATDPSLMSQELLAYEYWVARLVCSEATTKVSVETGVYNELVDVVKSKLFRRRRTRLYLAEARTR